MSFSAAVLFVCLGNICRSPLGEGIMKDYVKKQGLSDKIKVYSCATSSYHIGQHPHSGGIACAKRHGIDISDYRASQIQKKDFEEYDLIIAMDRYAILLSYWFSCWSSSFLCLSFVLLSFILSWYKMLRDNYEDLKYYKKSHKASDHAQIKMLSDFLPGREGEDVPDAYYANGTLFYSIVHL